MSVASSPSTDEVTSTVPPSITGAPSACTAQRVAGYYNAVREVLAERGWQDLLLSPEFLDDQSRNELLNYLIAYSAAGGGFGHVIAWHPYHGLNDGPAPSARSTIDFLSMVQQPQEVWITELGAAGDWATRHTPEHTEAHQHALLAAAHQAAGAPGDGPEVMVRLSAALYRPFDTRGHSQDLITIRRLAADVAARIGDRRGEAQAREDVAYLRAIGALSASQAHVLLHQDVPDTPEIIQSNI